MSNVNIPPGIALMLIGEMADIGVKAAQACSTGQLTERAPDMIEGALKEILWLVERSDPPSDDNDT